MFFVWQLSLSFVFACLCSCLFFSLAKAKVGAKGARPPLLVTVLLALCSLQSLAGPRVPHHAISFRTSRKRKWHNSPLTTAAAGATPALQELAQDHVSHVDFTLLMRAVLSCIPLAVVAFSCLCRRAHQHACANTSSPAPRNSSAAHSGI